MSTAMDDLHLDDADFQGAENHGDAEAVAADVDGHAPDSCAFGCGLQEGDPDPSRDVPGLIDSIAQLEGSCACQVLLLLAPQ